MTTFLHMLAAFTLIGWALIERQWTFAQPQGSALFGAVYGGGVVWALVNALYSAVREGLRQRTATWDYRAAVSLGIIVAVLAIGHWGQSDTADPETIRIQTEPDPIEVKIVPTPTPTAMPAQPPNQ